MCIKNKKAQFFSITLVIAVIGLLIYAYGVFHIKQNSFEHDIGDKQLGLFKTYFEAEKTLFYTDQSAKYAVYQSIYDLGKNGGYFKEPECGKYGNFVLWSNNNENCFPDARTIRTSTNAFLNKYLNSYLDRKNNYDFIIEDIEEVYEIKDGKFELVTNQDLVAKLKKELKEIKTSETIITYTDEGEEKKLSIEWTMSPTPDPTSGIMFPIIREIDSENKKTRTDFRIIKNLRISSIAASPILLSVYCNTDTKGCGEYAIKPNTLVELDYNLSFYDKIVEEAKEINEICSKVKDATGCVKTETSKRDWEITYQGVEQSGIDHERAFGINIPQNKELFVYENQNFAANPVKIKFALHIYDDSPEETS